MLCVSTAGRGYGASPQASRERRISLTGLTQVEQKLAMEVVVVRLHGPAHRDARVRSLRGQSHPLYARARVTAHGRQRQCV